MEGSGGKKLLLEMNITADGFSFNSAIEDARAAAEVEIEDLAAIIQAAAKLRPDCDKVDYALAASSGFLCGILDIFLVGKPGESPIGKAADDWFAQRTVAFARLFDSKGELDGSPASAIRLLEKKFKIPYDQRGAGDAGSSIFDLNPSNHHFKSLGHNPTLLGLFFSILDQFTNQAHFVSEGQLLSLQDADGSFALHGNSVPGKLFCGFINWFGHLVSDASGSSTSKGRGMGIPAPFLAWTNDVIAIKSKLNLPVTELDKHINQVALEIYQQGFDVRFLAAQAVPVFVNEVVVRFLYAMRRLLNYLSQRGGGKLVFSQLWQACEPFSNATVKRMLTVAHGTFCLVDVGEAVLRGFAKGGGAFNAVEFVLRLNIVGVGRFAFCLLGEAEQAFKLGRAQAEAGFAEKQKLIVEDYLCGLTILAKRYDDRELVNFVDDFQKSNLYKEAFQKTVTLARRRGVPEDKTLKDKNEIDVFFGGGRQQGGNW